MSSGSYFTIYRKTKDKVSSDVIDNLKNEYFLANKNSLCSSQYNDEDLKNDIPMLMESNFKYGSLLENESDIYYDKDGYVYKRLLDFNFNSTFRSLKEKFNLNPYRHSQSSVIIDRNEAKMINQAVKYVLSEKYDKNFEKILDNEYVELLGNGYSLFDNRFKKSKNPIYIKKNDDGYEISFDDGYENEIEDWDSDIIFSLKKVGRCLEAYLNADDYSFDNERLILVYSAF